MKTRKNIKIFTLSGLSISAIVAVPIALVACSSSSISKEELEKSINQYIANINTIKLSATSKVNSSVSVDKVTSSNINTYVSGIPVSPAGVEISYQLNPDAYSGTISIVITASANGVDSQNAQPQTISGFQNAAELFVLEANKVLNQLSLNQEGKVTLISDIKTKDQTGENLKSINSLLDTSILPQAKDLTLSYVVTSVDKTTGSATFYIAVFQKDFSMQTNLVTINGFPTSIINQFQNLNLQTNSSFAPPQNTNNYVDFANSGSIFANFIMNNDQIQFLQSIENLNIKVTNASLSTGQATLEFFQKVNNSYNSLAKITYNNFFKGTSTDAKTSIEAYLKNNNNVATWLNTYLNINPSWLNSIFTGHLDGGFFYTYNIPSTDKNKVAFNNIVVSNINNIITINATMPNPISYEIWNSNSSKFVISGTTESNQPVTIQLPFIFQTIGDKNTQIIPTISTTSSGQTTIAWHVGKNGFTYDNVNYQFHFENINMGFRLSTTDGFSINSIVF